MLFDGEESPDDTRTSTRPACAARGPTRAGTPSEIRALILLDFVAEKGAMRIPREASSDLELWAQLRAAAREVGAQAAFPDERRAR